MPLTFKWHPVLWALDSFISGILIACYYEPHCIIWACYTRQMMSLPAKQLHFVLSQTANFGNSTSIRIRNFKTIISQCYYWFFSPNLSLPHHHSCCPESSFYYPPKLYHQIQPKYLRIYSWLLPSENFFAPNSNLYLGYVHYSSLLRVITISDLITLSPSLSLAHNPLSSHNIEWSLPVNIHKIMPPLSL